MSLGYLVWPELYKKEDLHGDDIIATLKGYVESSSGILSDTVTGLFEKVELSSAQFEEIIKLSRIGVTKCLERGERRGYTKPSSSVEISLGMGIPAGISSIPDSSMPIFEFDALQYRRIAGVVESILSRKV